MIVRRTRLIGAQAELFPDWRHFAFLTNRTDDITIVEAEHRDHAVVEQVIADLKDQALAHFPSGHFDANGAWTVLAALAHNLLRWTQLLGLPDTTVRAARTLRRRLLQHPRPPDTPRTRLDAAPARPLALARRLHQRAQRHPRAARRRLTRPAPSPTTSNATPPPGAIPAARERATAPAAAPNSPTPPITPPDDADRQQPTPDLHAHACHRRSVDPGLVSRIVAVRSAAGALSHAPRSKSSVQRTCAMSLLRGRRPCRPDLADPAGRPGLADLRGPADLPGLAGPVGPWGPAGPCVPPAAPPSLAPPSPPSGSASASLTRTSSPVAPSRPWRTMTESLRRMSWTDEPTFTVSRPFGVTQRAAQM